MKGKVIIASIIACVALLLAIGVSRVAIKTMLQRVDALSVPNERLRTINNIFKQIAQLDKQQGVQISYNNGNSAKLFTKQAEPLLITIDTLASYYQAGSTQSVMIDSIKQLLLKRQGLLMDYINVRNGLISSKVFSQQIEQITGKISNRPTEVNKVVTIKERTIQPTDSTSASKKVEKNNFFTRLFKKKRKTEKAIVTENVVTTTVDTLGLEKQDSMMHEMQSTISDIEKKQQRQRNQFITQETALTKANSILTDKVLFILGEVEKEVVAENQIHNTAATELVGVGIKRLGYIILVFLMVTILLVYLIITDIAKSNRYKKELERAKEEAEYHSMAKQRFLSNISHEIRTPLQSIIGYAELMHGDSKATAGYIDIIHQSSGHLLQIVNEVLDYSRIISNKFTFEKKSFQLQQVINEVVANVETQAIQKGLTLVLETSLKGDECMLGDPFRLKQVLYNLLGNAIKFTDQGSIALKVIHEVRDGIYHCTLKVLDTGRGIDASDIDHIFNEFEQAATQQSVGTGLGLSIVKQLVEAQEGFISVTSELGKGSQFTVQLAFAEVATIDVKIEQVSQIFGYTKVWVIDDDPFILRLCSAIFEKHGVPHQCFDLPEQMLAATYTSDVGLILVDIRMPTMNGGDLCKELRKTMPAHVMICALTAQVLPEERESLLQQGFNKILTKPFRERDLLSLLPHAPLVGDEKLDMDLLKQMTFGDEAQIADIIQQFISDTQADMRQLLSFVKTDASDSETISLLLHRIAGRTLQMGWLQIGEVFKRLELAVLDTDKISNVLKEEVKVAVQRLGVLLSNIQH